jgi:hypothetical protein
MTGQMSELTPREYLETFLYVKDRETAQVVPLVLYPIQKQYLDGATQRDIILKSRRQGLSTAIGAEFFSDQQTSKGLDCKVVAHRAESTRYLLEMVRLFYLSLPPRIQVKTENFNMNAITFPSLNASYAIETAGAESPGRAMAIHRLHVSELAFWEYQPEEQFRGLSGCVPSTGKIRIESTPNGQGNLFHQLYQEAKLGLSSYRAWFFPWFQDPGYSFAPDHLLTLPKDRGDLEYSAEESKLAVQHGLTQGQIRWRRWAKAEYGDMFDQEFPEDDVKCFLVAGLPFFDKVALVRAMQNALPPLKTVQEGTGWVRIWENPDPTERYAFGADASEGLEKGDRAGMFVFSLHTGHQVATLHGVWTPSEFAKLIDQYGRRYNDAYGAIENDKYGALVLKYLEEKFCYPNLHYHPSTDNPKEVKIGYPTTSLSKIMADEELNDGLKSAELQIRDKEVLGEMSSYVKLRSGKVGATAGTHDDLVSAAKIAWQMRKYAPTRPIKTTEEARYPRFGPYGTNRRPTPAFKRYLDEVRT